MIDSKRIFKKQKLNIFLIIALFFIVFILPFKNKKINVILISIECVRPDHLSCYSYQRKTSPHIDALAKNGILFTQAISLSSWTAPSFAGIVTSNYPHTFGDLSVWGNNRDISSMPTLQGVLKRNGYSTAFFTFHSPIDLIRGFGHNFDIFEIVKKGGDNTATQNAIDWLEKNRNSPFFLWIHYFGPHKSDPPRPYNTLFLNDGLYKGDRHISLGKDAGEIWNVIPSEISKDGITAVDYYISQYDGEIAFVDRQIAILLEEIKSLNLDKNVLIIITADHGQSLGEHGYYFTHENNLYDCLINVPLVIVGKGVPQSNIIEQQISMIDLTPTILDILDINKPKQMTGSSFLSLIRNGKIGSNNHFVFSERDYDDKGRGKRAIRTTGWKLIEDFAERRTYELYNLKDDPKELNNLVSIEIEKFHSLKHKLDTWVKQTKVVIPHVKRQPLDEKTKEYLRSLGYVQ